MPRVLVCPPTYFGVEYVINPWMAGNVGSVSPAAARRQWDALVAILDDLAEVSTIEPSPGLPDMCFAANGGFVLAGAFVPATFSVPQRRPETTLYRTWAEATGFHIVDGDDVAFEGEGDALWWPHFGEPLLCAGYGVRTGLEAHRPLSERLRVRVVSLRLVDERFYHLDTCFVPLSDGRVIYYPPAFDERSRRIIASLAPRQSRIEVGDEDAHAFACNAVRLGRTLIANYASKDLRRRLAAWGYDVVSTPLDEFMKAGGAAKCLTLILEQDAELDLQRRTPVTSPICSTTVELDGHLLDQGILNRTYDAVNLAGGSVRLERFRGGERTDQPSHACVQVSAPDQTSLNRIVTELSRGESSRNTLVRIADNSENATLVEVERSGVAPDDFCCSTIYPTDVRVRGRWLRVSEQRMDATIVVDGELPTARCVLLRDLRRGDKVVCGEIGVRVRVPSAPARQGFAFMSSQVTSERHVAGLVDELALELRRIRARDGRTVVVAGPVVIHTGGGRHLAQLVRAGYVQALLTGNALAVHDIESDLFGTSLGVDLQRGAGVRGGHRHHLRAINRIRAAGSIAAAVRSGIVTSGVMYECVRAGVPFELAGSIRDDGPLPDTRMNLVAAQGAYARRIAGADLILMLATTLHAIGVGNMAPAEVRLVCVDLSPAAVTKLADRGSVEATGIVTDVGLFLKLLAERLAD